MCRKILFFLTCLSLFISSLLSEDYSSRKIISVEKNQEVVNHLREMSLDLVMEWKNRIYIHASLDDLGQLKNKNILYLFETQDFKPLNKQPLNIQGGINGAYHSYPELERALMDLAESHPQIVQVLDIGDSLEKRNIFALKISDNANITENEAQVVFLGCHHAREWISVEMPFLLGKFLAENYATNPEIKALVDRSEIWIIPLVNPDGLEYTIHFYRYWRKNRRNNGDGSYGVDLNRNYGYKWGVDDIGSSPESGSGVYRGESPFSEPETAAILDLFSQKNFQALVSYHSYSQVIMYPWGYTLEATENDALLSSIAEKMSSLMQAVNGRFYEFGRAGSSLYLTNGDATDWAFGLFGIPSYTIELPPIDQIFGQFFNAEEDIQSIFNENLPAALYMIEWTIQNHTNKMSRFTEKRINSVRKSQNSKMPDYIQKK